jgi:DNA-binding CsgD family transcriptional regulator
MSLRCPPLRERRGDILPLARRAIQACARGSQAALSLSIAAERKLLVEHDWPGNARELTNIVQRAAWLATGGQIDAEDLDLQATAVAGAEQVLAAPGGATTGRRTTHGPPRRRRRAQMEPGLDRDLKERERELILATLRVTGGSRKLAAERLGISPRTLRHKLQQFKAAGVIVPRLHEPIFRDGLNHEQHANSTSAGGNARTAGARGGRPGRHRNRRRGAAPVRGFRQISDEELGGSHRRHAEPGDRARAGLREPATRASTSPR